MAHDIPSSASAGGVRVAYVGKSLIHCRFNACRGCSSNAAFIKPIDSISSPGSMGQSNASFSTPGHPNKGYACLGHQLQPAFGHAFDPEA